jgi:hypothetical protein
MLRAGRTRVASVARTRVDPFQRIGEGRRAGKTWGGSKRTTPRARPFPAPPRWIPVRREKYSPTRARRPARRAPPRNSPDRTPVGCDRVTFAAQIGTAIPAYPFEQKRPNLAETPHTASVSSNSRQTPPEKAHLNVWRALGTTRPPDLEA